MTVSLCPDPTRLLRRDDATQHREIDQIAILLQVFVVRCSVRPTDRVREVESQRATYEFRGVIGSWNVSHDTP